MSAESVIPPGYTFLNVNTFVSIKAKAIADKLFSDADNRNPDAFDMYIYNDFFAYGVLELVDKTLATLHTKIVKKQWEEAYCLLEALLVFADFESVWTQCDHGDRVNLTCEVIGASAFAVFRGLKDTNQLNPARYPNLEGMLKKVYSFAEDMQRMGSDLQDYGYFCKAVARRVFESKTDVDFALEVKQLNEWLNSTDVDEEDKAEMQKEIEAISNDEPKNKRWYAEGKIVDETDKSIRKLSSVWKEYKECLGESPRLPMRGPAKWDLTKWSAAQRRQFEFGAMNDDDD